MIVTVCLNPAVDKSSEIFFLPAKTFYRASYSKFEAGGKAVNAARVLKILGADSFTIGFAGGITGEMFETLLRKDRIEGSFIKTRDCTRINVTLSDPKSDVEVHIVDPGPEVRAGELQKLKKLFLKILGENTVECVILSGSLPPGAPDDFYRELIASAKSKGVITALDTSGNPLKEAIAAGPEIVKPNSDELDELAGKKLAKIRDKTAFAAGLGVREVLVSMGKSGSFLSAGKTVTRVGAIKTEPGDYTGSGDALLAGYLFARILKNKAVSESLMLGAACAQANCSRSRREKIILKKINYYKRLAKAKRSAF